MSCPVGWASALRDVLWEEYGMYIKTYILLILLAINLWLYWK